MISIHTKVRHYMKNLNPLSKKKILNKLDIHHTPKHGSWVNVAEIELGHLGRQCLDRTIPGQESFIRETSPWCDERNKSNCVVDWQFVLE